MKHANKTSKLGNLQLYMFMYYDRKRNERQALPRDYRACILPRQQVSCNEASFVTSHVRSVWLHNPPPSFPPSAIATQSALLDRSISIPSHLRYMYLLSRPFT